MRSGRRFMICGSGRDGFVFEYRVCAVRKNNRSGARYGIAGSAGTQERTLSRLGGLGGLDIRHLHTFSSSHVSPVTSQRSGRTFATRSIRQHKQLGSRSLMHNGSHYHQRYPTGSPIPNPVSSTWLDPLTLGILYTASWLHPDDRDVDGYHQPRVGYALAASPEMLPSSCWPCSRPAYP